MAWRGLTKQQWEAIRVHLPEPKVSPRGDARASKIGAVLKASSRSYGPAPNGASCPSGTAVPASAGGGSSTGKRPACCSRSGGPFWPSSMTDNNSAGTNALSMAALSPPNRGAQSRHHHAGQGHEVDGSGRWRGSSAGSIPGGDVLGGGHAPRADPPHSRGRPPGDAWTPPQTPEAPDCQSGR